MLLELDGLKISYDCAGKGESVVLLHGWGGSMASFKPVFAYLAKNYRVYALDFPGFGLSDPPKDVWGAEEYGSFILKFLRAVGIERANVIAHSFGGRVAIWLAANFPEMVNRLVLVNSAGIKPKRKLKYYIKVGMIKAGKRLLPVLGRFGEHLLQRLYQLIGSKDYQQQTGIMRSILVRVVNEDLSNLLPEITAPTLLIWGENDRDVPLVYARTMEKKIKDAGLVVFKNAGHFSYLDKFTDFCLIMDSFLVTAQ